MVDTPKDLNSASNAHPLAVPGRDQRAVRDIIVIGASAGGLRVLEHLVDSLPHDFSSSVFIVLHVGARSPGLLARILGRNTSLPVSAPADRTPIEGGQIYVASPDLHLLIEDGHVRSAFGPKENRVRPAIDPLFRSAAWAFGPRVVGVVLTGTQGDGAAGLWAIASRGGLTVVQDPDEAPYPEMPQNALRLVQVNYRLGVEEIATLLVELSPRFRTQAEHQRTPPEEPAMSKGTEAVRTMPGSPSVFACPSCRGTLWQVREDELSRYRCHVGHSFTLESLVDEQREQTERSLYSALSLMQAQSEAWQRLAEAQPGGEAAREPARKRLEALQACIMDLQRLLQDSGSASH